MATEENVKRRNIYFRQTPKEFKSAKQTQAYEHIKMNIPYRIYQFTKENLSNVFTEVKGRFLKIKMNLPRGAKRVK